MKNKLIFFTPFLLTLLLPELAFAADSGSSINFQPPAQDFSIVFLSNIFGVVDGVLHGTGSQIIGNMFGVFNSAVLTLGGIVAVYTLLVSTMNTAHEGEMLGKKWSSVWIPVRTVFGISLMLPKATGYCMLQVVTMWIVVQGVGAADKVWDAALDYLQRGGVIIQPNINPAATSSGASGTILQGAAGMLAGQVCMLGMQKLLSNIHDAAVSDTTDTSSICFKRAGESDYSSADLQQFCNNGVPDFISTINLSTAKPKSNVYSMEMPNFTSKNKLYSALNGACGTIKWKGLSSGQVSALQNQLTSSEMDSSKKARTIAMQQMFNTLTSVAQSMVNNDPQLNTTLTCSKDSPCASAHPENEALSIAKDPLGVAVTIDGGECQAKNNCKAWGNNPVETTGQDGTVLLTGQELQGAVQDYYGLMLATLNAAEGGVACVSASKAGGAGTNILGQSEGNSCDTKAFMAQARSQGWLMAGAYFFKLAALNTVSAGAIGGSSAESAGVSVNAEGGGGQFNTNKFQTYFDGGGKCPGARQFFCSGQGGRLGSAWYFPMLKLMNNIKDDGSPSIASWVSLPTGLDSARGGSIPINAQSLYSENINTVFSYLLNAGAFVPQGQVGQTAPTFVMHFNFNASTPITTLPSASFSGGMFGIPGDVASLIYNGIVRTVFNLLLQITMPIINQLFFMLVSPPILLLSGVFASAIKLISNPEINPIIALAQMGSAYVNGTATMWVEMAAMAAGAAAIGPAAMGLLALVLPVVMSWMGVMVAVGINCAYYVPFVPYLLFTFGVFAWMIAVVEAMVAAPIVALGVTHPEGHEAFGKGDQAIMLVLNVFLRPSMMIFGFIFGIILSYVGTWLINTGFGIVLNDIYNLGGPSESGETSATRNISSTVGGIAAVGAGVATGGVAGLALAGAGGSAIGGGQAKTYSQWTGLYMYFFSLVLYTSMYVAVVQKSFTLIYMLPDKILRWLSGGQQESLGEGVAGGMQKEVKDEVAKGEKATDSGLQQLNSAAKQGGDSASSAGSMSAGG